MFIQLAVKELSRIIKYLPKHSRFSSSKVAEHQDVLACPSYFQLCNKFETLPKEAEDLISSMQLTYDFITEEEENSLFNEVDPFLKRMRYEVDHWDDAIARYRETERLKWNKANTQIIERIRKVAFPPDINQIKYVHVLDLEKDGYIKAHIDAIRFCGDTIAGISLLTDSVMRLVHDKNKELFADILLKRRSLYIMKGTARFDYTHEILPNEKSIFRNEKVFKDRRISVICRNEPEEKYKD